MPNNTFILENDFLNIKIKAKGAELCSLYNKQTKLEYLWNAGEAWPKHAPVLFPIVGQLKNNEFLYNKQSYFMERHGFARTRIFTAKAQGPDKIIFSLGDDTNTLLVFPFPFLLAVQYQISENSLTVTYQVKNTGSKTMLFSIGAHPAFKIPLQDEENYEDYYLLFEKNELIEQHLLQNGLTDGSKKAVDLSNRMLKLTKTLFYDDAIVIKNLQSESISIKSNASNHGIHFNFKGYPYFGIWAAKNADFVCLEPWHGITDNIHHNQEIEKKEGIISLLPENTFACSFQMLTY